MTTETQVTNMVYNV